MTRALAALLFVTSSSLDADPPRLDLYGDPLPAGAVARLGTVQLRPASVRKAHFAADGKTFHGPLNGPAWGVWDVATGKQLRRVPLDGVTGSLPYSSADGSTALVEQPNGERNVLDIATGKSRLALPKWVQFGETRQPFSPDGRHVAAFDGANLLTNPQHVHLWDTRSGETWNLGPMVSGHGPIVFSPDGARLIAVDGAGVTCWTVADRKQLWRAAVGYAMPNIQFSPDGSRIALEFHHNQTGREITVWDAATGKPPPGLKPPPKGTTSLALTFTMDNREFLTSYGDRQVREMRWWNLETGEWRTLPNFNGYEAVLSPDGKSVLDCGFDQIQVFDATTGETRLPVVHKRRHDRGTTDVVFLPSGTRLATTGKDGTVRLWDAADGRELNSAAIDVPYASVAPGGEPRLVATGGKCVAQWFDGQRRYMVAVIDAETWKVTKSFPHGKFDLIASQQYFGQPFIGTDGALRHIRTYTERDPAVRGAGGLLTKNEVRTYNLATGEAGRAVPVPIPLSWGRGAISPCGQLLAAFDTVADARTGKIRFPLRSPDGSASGGAAFSADSRFVASRVPGPKSPDKKPRGGVYVWDTVTGSVVARIHTASQRHALTPDGRRLVTLDETGVSVWDVASGVQLRHYKVDPRGDHTEGAITQALAVSPDGRRAATARLDGTGLVWDVSVDRPKASPPSRLELLAVWAALADPATASPISLMWVFVDNPNRATSFLAARVRATVSSFVPPAWAVLIGQLDDDEFATRESAEKRLAELGEVAREPLTEGLKVATSAEQRTRIARLLAKLDAAPVPELRKEDVPLAWALAALERIGTPEARDVIRVMASGPPASRLTREAVAALERLPK